MTLPIMARLAGVRKGLVLGLIRTNIALHLDHKKAQRCWFDPNSSIRIFHLNSSHTNGFSGMPAQQRGGTSPRPIPISNKSPSPAQSLKIIGSRSTWSVSGWTRSTPSSPAATRRRLSGTASTSSCSPSTTERRTSRKSKLFLLQRVFRFLKTDPRLMRHCKTFSFWSTKAMLTSPTTDQWHLLYTHGHISQYFFVGLSSGRHR